MGTACSTSAVVVATTITLAAVAVPLTAISVPSYVSAIAATAVSKKAKLRKI